MLTTLPAQSQPEANPQVLILNSFDEGTAPFFEARNVFMTELQRLYPATIAFRQFDLGERGQDGESSHELKAQLLHGQYANGPPDLVLALGPPALTFWLQHRDSVFGHTPVIAGVGEYALYQAQLRPGDAVVAPHFSFPELVENILTLAPGTSRIVMVFGPSALERGQSELAKKQLEAYSGRVAFEYTNDFSVADLQRRLSSLPEGSAVLYGVFDSDVNGVTLSGHSGLALVRAASRAPVFGTFDDQLGLGIVGGRLIQIAQAGRELARVADTILRDAGPPDPLTVVAIGEPVYDWRELQAWKIHLDRLPPGSDVRFRPPSPWAQYAPWILLVTAVFLLQGALIATLLLQRRRRRAAESASLSLSSKLITAHEDERRRVARELHDDLSQRLARLAIDASYVGSGAGGEQANEVMKKLYPELVSISKDVHDISYRLHPSLVDDLGIAAALRTECDRVRRRADAAVIEKICEIPEKISHDVALCVFRIAQEALHNAIRHAQADTIEVALDYDGYMLMLVVRDNGIGFDVTAGYAGSGLGLSSMQERVHLVGGSLRIRSRLGDGTTVRATVPWKGAAE